MYEVLEILSSIRGGAKDVIDVPAGAPLSRPVTPAISISWASVSNMASFRLVLKSDFILLYMELATTNIGNR